MMSRVGLELTNFINPDLTWKTVSKGYRTGTRRSRKQLIKNKKVGAEAVDIGGDMVEAETNVSESEKLGVAVLGGRFSDKIEHVPIKKRRFLFRSPSPPPRRYAPSLEECGQLVDRQHLRTQVRPKSTSRKQLKTNAASTIKIAHSTDFSGIEILAEAACSNSIGDDAVIPEGSLVEESKREVTDSLTSGVPPQETVASSDIINCSLKDTMHEERKEDTVACLENHPRDMDDGMVKRSASLHDDRLHWDLNLSMDAWEQPPETGSQALSVEGTPMDNRKADMPQISEWCESQKEDSKQKVGSTGNIAEGGLVSSEDINLKSSIPETCKSDMEINNLELYTSTDKNYDKSAPASGDHAQESSTEGAENVKTSIQLVSKDACADQPPCSPTVDVTNLQVVDDIVEHESEVDDKQKAESDASGLKSDIDQVRNYNVASPSEPVIEKVSCETDSSILNEVAEDPGKKLGLYARNSQERMSIGSCPPSPIPVDPASKAEELCVSPSANSEVMSTSGAPCGEGLHGAADDSNGHKDEAVVLNADKVDSPHRIESSPVGATNCSSSTGSSDKVSVGEHPAGGFDSDACPHAKGHIVSMENNKQDGYDSQFEDGELRETDLCWDNDDGEAEFVDYDSDDVDVDAADYSVTMSGQVEVGSECDKEGMCVSEGDMEKRTKGDSCRLSASYDHVIENGECLEDAFRESGWSEISANPTSGITEGRSIKHSADSVDKVDMKDIPTRAIGSKPSRKDWQASTDILDRKDAIPGRRERSDNFDDSYPRVEGMAGPDKSTGRERPALHLQSRSPSGGHSLNPPGSFQHVYYPSGRERPALRMRSRSPSGGHSFNPSGSFNHFYPSESFRDSKRGRSPTNYGSYNSGRPRPKSVVESRGNVMASDNAGSDAVPGLDNRICRSPSNGVYRPHGRRRSPSEREDAYGMPTGMGPDRDISPDRRRFGRYPQRINRGFREEYHRQLPDGTTEYSNRLPHRMTRRQRSISPPCGRVPPHYPQPFKKSRSRSRSRSPVGWLLPRNRNEGPRRPSRSTEFRSKGRTERTRMPFQRPGLEPGYEAGFMSPPGNRFSPPRNSRWFDDRSCGVDNFRGRRSPVRMFRQNQRFDSVRPMRRMNSSDDGSRPPMIYPAGRYADMYGAGRGRKYEGGEDDRRINGERYDEWIKKKYEGSEDDRRISGERYDEWFKKRNGKRYPEFSIHRVRDYNNYYDDCNRSIDRRPRDVLLRRGSEEKYQPRLNQEQPIFSQDQQSGSNQEQARLNQDQQSGSIQEQPRLNQDQQPILNQDNKVMNNTSPKSLGVLEEEAAA